MTKTAKASEAQQTPRTLWHFRGCLLEGYDNKDFFLPEGYDNKEIARRVRQQEKQEIQEGT